MRETPAPDPLLHNAFREGLRQRALDPENRWIGGYVAYEWDHARHLFDCSGVEFAGRRVLEFGCNIGATAIVLAHLGANVTAIDVMLDEIDLAQLNAAQYALKQPVSFLHVADSTAIPFSGECFDVVVCNSVLEYVAPTQLKAVQTELNRVLKPGGALFVMGTSSRLAAREVHSRRWLVNYLPSVLDSFLELNGSVQRGIWPCAVRHGFGSHYDDLDHLDRAQAYFQARQLMGASRLKLGLLRVAARLAATVGWSVGMLTPNISLRLRKTGSSAIPASMS
ncbi:MAG: class I SAM-dependent methyltransferase [Burkholderiales bacterium]